MTAKINSPLVSIIIPVFNRAHLIGETLDSIKKQTYTNWECILVDDGSTDNSKSIIHEYVKKDDRFKFFERPTYLLKGANSCRNYGFNKSKGIYIKWFDSDDLLHKEAISRKIKVFNEHKELDGVLCQLIMFKGESLEGSTIDTRAKASSNLLEDFLLLKVSWITNSVMWRRDFLLAENVFFKEGLMKGQDRDFHTRILLKSPNLYFLDLPLVYYRKHTESITELASEEVILTLLESYFERIDLLLVHGISNELKTMFARLIIQLYPSTYTAKGTTMKIVKNLWKLKNHELGYWLWVLRFLILAPVMQTTGKGSLIVKGQ
jgi:glycosyltransferase involved in cell wall biosynthesis